MNIVPVSRAATIAVPADYGTIQGAIDHSHAGDVIAISPGTYYENLVVDQAITLMGTGATMPVIDGSTRGGNGIKVTANDVRVQGLTLTHWGNGVYISLANYVTVTGCNLTANGDAGINLSSSAFANVSYNNITDSKFGYGIYIENSANNRFIGNNIVHNFYSIYFSDSDDKALDVENQFYYNFFSGAMFDVIGSPRATSGTPPRRATTTTMATSTRIIRATTGAVTKPRTPTGTGSSTSLNRPASIARTGTDTR